MNDLPVVLAVLVVIAAGLAIALRWWLGGDDAR
jgi:hypothetical protein